MFLRETTKRNQKQQFKKEFISQAEDGELRSALHACIHPQVTPCIQQEGRKGLTHTLALSVCKQD